MSTLKQLYEMRNMSYKCDICGSSHIKLRHNRFGFYYICLSCGARAGCRKGTTIKSSTFADDETRKLRVECHGLMDYKSDGRRRWNNAKQRRECYNRLANCLQMDNEACHFSKMNKLQLERAKIIMSTWE